MCLKVDVIHRTVFLGERLCCTQRLIEKEDIVSEGTARNKLPLSGGVSIPQLRQPPPLQHRVATSVKVAPAGGFAAKPEEDKTTAYKVPEELLRRARTGFVPTQVDEEKSPDSGAITAPPPVEAYAQLSHGAPRPPGVPHDLLMSLLRAEQEEDEEVTIMRPSTAHLSELDEFDADSWGSERDIEFPLISRTNSAVSRAPAAANDPSGRAALRGAPKVKPGVSPVVLWLVVASIMAAATALVWLVR